MHQQAPTRSSRGHRIDRRSILGATASLAAVAVSSVWPLPARAQKSYGPGVTDSEIKIGQAMPYSGPASAFGSAGRMQLAYMKMINAAGGINGRQVRLISLDDGFSPPKTIEVTRKLVEEDGVLAIMGSVGTPTNVVIAKYLNTKGVPQLVAASGSSKLNDSVNLPWTATFSAPQVMEGRLYAQHLLLNKPDAKIAVLFQNDDYGKGSYEAFRLRLGEKAATMIVKDASYELSDPTIDNQILALRASGADTFFHITTPKFAAQAIRKAHEIGWKPFQIVIWNAAGVTSTLKPAGLEASKGLISSLSIKMPGDPAWANDKGMQDYYAFVKKWAPDLDPDDSAASFGYSMAMMSVELLKRCGDNLTRENLMKQALSVTDLQLPLFLPGVRINTTPTSRAGWNQAKLARFDGTSWVLSGDVITIDTR
jgi:branched-chain amino acid transport system substrate-binding protein